MSFAELNTLLRDRHSCRAFLPDPVPRAQIEQIVASASRVPSWCNAQPWQLAITSADETDTFREAMQNEAVSGTPAPDLPFPTSYSGVYQDRRRACGWALYEAVGVERGDRAGSAQQMMQNFSLFGAPHCAILSSPAELGPYGAMDCGGFVTAFTLAAQALGVATIPQAALATYGPFLHRYFQIPKDRLILCAISFGFADPDHPANNFRTDRAAPSDFVQWRG
ncbi:MULTISPECIES: nitroreductase family protein [unclassified Ruegeria]|uniref:nitroreductase n=1 Tax=unclassified Ruegeria TaxID=2625375 RepID=UPI001491F5C9|nr:nitroreductase [Ruegeria sp. HKCCD5849]NOD52237.1 nitroreductase [Ruegeria sp. HKCCD5851]NOD68340.1 nitroreductase [Ruegeria sp. HKCCD7303]